MAPEKRLTARVAMQSVKQFIELAVEDMRSGFLLKVFRAEPLHREDNRRRDWQSQFCNIQVATLLAHSDMLTARPLRHEQPPDMAIEILFFTFIAKQGLEHFVELTANDL
jgi:hypothetical protein